MLMEAKGVEIPDDSAATLYIASMGDECAQRAFSLCMKIREAGISCECDLMERGVKAQFKYADKIRAKYVLVIGSGELESGKVTVKRMSDGVTVECELSDSAILGAIKA